ncbi:hypothetical protein P3342_008302 [Pyrenophora teres f. teres]|uniref:Tripeptidyl-peptidase 1 n=1 Tax=Pyrenophora teres f. teres TaxID=97479 RepID=A0A6S6W513_9PLEO|nr:hypothetical protein HRS9139_07081 [Pyrenophora teres f. teres]KAE8830457.1 hypothetical protein PTNB85_07044 [Pyrenophora teres f. teres]KAE8857542.1 hypothetical protein PTNB29_08609 [Pyrenophora teres f. teres]KAK1910423.1 hypothetical protein P3342_008302 [Pyrenophora teres f. teres]CAE7185119.1 Tripeptidyl-peptidase 1 [Pyrenophora teres f. teres]
MTGLLDIAGFHEEYAIISEYTSFLKSYGIFTKKSRSFTCTTVNGGFCSSSPAGTEANLDIQYAGTILTSVPNIHYCTAGRGQFFGSRSNTHEPYIEFLQYLPALPD